MLRKILIAGVIVALLPFSRSVVAQSRINLPTGSIEKDYAELCANKPAPETETCAALKRALLEKLNGPGSGGRGETSVAAASSSPTAPSSEHEMSLRWGYLAQVVGKTYFDTIPGLGYSIATYAWEIPGESMLQTVYSATKTAEADTRFCPPSKVHLRLSDEPGSITLTSEAAKCAPPGTAQSRVQPDGSIISTSADGKYRYTSRLSPDGSISELTEERNRNGEWAPTKLYGMGTLRELTPELLSQLRRTSSENADSEGNNGLLGALAMGLGAAMAGGNAEQVMGMAMKGAELTTDNEMTRNVLAGQGDAMVASGSVRQPTENASYQGTQSGSPALQLPAATANLPSASPSTVGQATQAHAGRGPKTFRAFFYTIYVNPDDADHNTFCQSNIFSFTVPAWNSDTAGDDIDAVLGPMKSTFAQKCVEAAGRPLAGNPMYEVEIWGRKLELKPLRAGDHQVTMP